MQWNLVWNYIWCKAPPLLPTTTTYQHYVRAFLFIFIFSFRIESISLRKSFTLFCVHFMLRCARRPALLVSIILIVHVFLSDRLVLLDYTLFSFSYYFHYLRMILIFMNSNAFYLQMWLIFYILRPPAHWLTVLVILAACCFVCLIIIAYMLYMFLHSMFVIMFDALVHLIISINLSSSLHYWSLFDSFYKCLHGLKFHWVHI